MPRVVTVIILIVVSIMAAYLSMLSETWGLSREAPLSTEKYFNRLLGRVMVFLAYAAMQVGIGYELNRRWNRSKLHALGAVMVAFVIAFILNVANPLIQGLFPWTIIQSLFWLAYCAGLFMRRDQRRAEPLSTG